MNKPKLSEKIKMLSVKFYRNLKRNLFYGIYFNKFHTKCNEKFKKCDHRIGNTFTFCIDIPFAAHFNCAKKKSTNYVKNLNTIMLQNTENVMSKLDIF